VAAVVVDTDVASHILRRRLTGRLAGRLAGADVCLTFVTVGELWKWAELRSWSLPARAELVDFLHNVVVLPYGESVARRWGEMAAAERRGRTLPVNDSWIAACCLARELPLATLNVKDYADVVQHQGLTLLTS
jgi:toxin FitB